jgi:hypothetical protein
MVLEAQSPETVERDLEVEALFKEARRRERKRRVVLGTIAIALLALVLGLGLDYGGTDSPHPPLSSSNLPAGGVTSRPSPGQRQSALLLFQQVATTTADLSAVAAGLERWGTAAWGCSQHLRTAGR